MFFEFDFCWRFYFVDIFIQIVFCIKCVISFFVYFDFEKIWLDDFYDQFIIENRFFNKTSSFLKIELYFLQNFQFFISINNLIESFFFHIWFNWKMSLKSFFSFVLYFDCLFWLFFWLLFAFFFRYGCYFRFFQRYYFFYYSSFFFRDCIVRGFIGGLCLYVGNSI